MLNDDEEFQKYFKEKKVREEKVSCDSISLIKNVLNFYNIEDEYNFLLSNISDTKTSK